MGSEMEDQQHRVRQSGLQPMRSLKWRSLGYQTWLNPERKQILRRENPVVLVDLAFRDAGGANADLILLHLVFDYGDIQRP